MRSADNEALFAFLGCISLVTGGFIAMQPSGKTSIPIDDQSTLVPFTSALATAAFKQDPRSIEGPETPVNSKSDMMIQREKEATPILVDEALVLRFVMQLISRKKSSFNYCD